MANTRIRPEQPIAYLAILDTTSLRGGSLRALSAQAANMRPRQGKVPAHSVRVANTSFSPEQLTAFGANLDLTSLHGGSLRALCAQAADIRTRQGHTPAASVLLAGTRLKLVSAVFFFRD